MKGMNEMHINFVKYRKKTKMDLEGLCQIQDILQKENYEFLITSFKEDIAKKLKSSTNIMDIINSKNKIKFARYMFPNINSSSFMDIILLEKGYICLSVHFNEESAKFLNKPESFVVRRHINEKLYIGDNQIIEIIAVYTNDEESIRNDIEKIQLLIDDVLNEKGSEEWNIIRETNNTFNELNEDYRYKNPTSEENTALRYIGEKKYRQFLLEIKKIKVIVKSDITKNKLFENSDVGSIIEELVKSGLVKREFTVMCTQNNSMSIRVQDKEQIRKYAKDGVKCGCGKPIGEEKIEELISISSLTKKLMDGSLWMTHTVVEVLKSLNISISDIIVEHEEDGDEIDVFLNLNGELAMFELKDREFSKGDAYKFTSKILKYKPDIAIIVSTDKIAQDGIDHLKHIEQDDLKIEYIQNLKQLKPKLSELVKESNIISLQGYLNYIVPETILNVPHYLNNFLSNVSSLKEVAAARES